MDERGEKAYNHYCERGFFLSAGVRKVRRFLFLRDNGVPLVRRSA